MPGSYTIGQLAREADVPTSTVRYYERRGLLRPDGRSEGNYRMYGEATLERLLFVRSAQVAGFTLTDITALLDFRDGDAAPCKEVQDLIIWPASTRWSSRRGTSRMFRACSAGG